MNVKIGMKGRIAHRLLLSEQAASWLTSWAMVNAIRSFVRPWNASAQPDASVPSPNCRHLCSTPGRQFGDKGTLADSKCSCGLRLANAYESAAAKVVGICETPHEA